MSEIILPTQKSKPKTINPGVIILFGKPKCGKTTLLSLLEDNLILSIDPRGADYVEAMSIQIKDVQHLREVRTAIAASEHKYKYISIDTATMLEEMILPLALDDYRQTSMGKNFGKNDDGEYTYVDIRTLPQGGGYLYIRNAYQRVLASFDSLCEVLILTGHNNDKTINKDGKDLAENVFDLSGKLGRIVMSKADAIGFMYRIKNQNFINFNGGGDTIIESRSIHLRGKNILIAESDENNVITAYWDKIFLPEKKNKEK